MLPFGKHVEIAMKEVMKHKELKIEFELIVVVIVLIMLGV